MSNRQSLEAICGLAFLDSLRGQGTKLQDADAAQLSVAFHAAAEAVAQAVEDELTKPFPENATDKAEYAVIQAARVHLKVNSMNSTAREIDEAHRGVMNAVLALDALDSEEG